MRWPKTIILLWEACYLEHGFFLRFYTNKSCKIRIFYAICFKPSATLSTTTQANHYLFIVDSHIGVTQTAQLKPCILGGFWTHNFCHQSLIKGLTLKASQSPRHLGIVSYCNITQVMHWLPILLWSFTNNLQHSSVVR